MSLSLEAAVKAANEFMGKGASNTEIARAEIKAFLEAQNVEILARVLWQEELKFMTQSETPLDLRVRLTTAIIEKMLGEVR